MKPHERMKRLGLLGLISCLFVTSINYASSEVNVLELTNRGSISDTPHVVPNNKWLVEGGYQHLSLSTDGPISTAPQAEIVRGLNFNTEVFVMIPTFFSQKTPRFSGNDTPALGTKHELVQGRNWLVSLQGIVILPGGSFEFGHRSTGVRLNAMTSYLISPQFDLEAMLGFSTESLPNLLEGGRFYSCNPSVALFYKPVEKINTYIEVFGQTKTDTFGGSILAVDCGILYKIAENTCLDFEFGQKLNHDRFNYTHYLGGGVTTVF
jgi:hypothetical protein